MEASSEEKNEWKSLLEKEDRCMNETEICRKVVNLQSSNSGRVQVPGVSHSKQQAVHTIDEKRAGGVDEDVCRG